MCSRMAHSWFLLSCWIWISMFLGTVAGEIFAFDLLPYGGSGSRTGEVYLTLGYPPQNVTVLATFYSESDASVLVPSARICEDLDESGSWNIIEQPSEGDVVRAGGGSGIVEGMQLVKWSASSETRAVNITLRKGSGSAERNVSLIERDIQNDGEYSWNVSRTVIREDLNEDNDYSLMLWTESPPRRSVSGYFSLASASVSSSSSAKAVLFPASDVTQSTCISNLLSAGGYYTSTLDENFTLGNYIASISNPNISYSVDITGGGTTTLSLYSALSFTNVSLSTLSQSSLGIGLLALSKLQQSQYPMEPEKGIVAMDLGTVNRTGSVVLGGYDSTLVDTSQSMVFSKQSQEIFEVFALGVIYAGANNTNIAIPYANISSPPRVFLSYELQGIKFPQTMLDSFLPLIGNPVYDENLDGFVYDNTTFEEDYSLLFSIGNGTNTALISIPATELVATESSVDNPLTPCNESGRTFLQVSNSMSDIYLGRAFLKYIYLIDSPANVGKFHINPVPAQRTGDQSLTNEAAIFESLDTELENASDGSSQRVGQIVGGIVGGVIVVGGGIIILLMALRRRRRRRATEIKDSDCIVGFEEVEPDKEIHSISGTDSRFSNRNDESQTFNPFDKELLPSIPPPTLAPPKTPESPSPPPPPPSPLYHPHRSQSLSGITYRPSPLEHSLHRTATIGKVIGKNQISTVDATSPPTSPIRRAKTVHARTASLGRVVTPLALEFENGVLVRRGSGSERSRGSRGSGRSKLNELEIWKDDGRREGEEEVEKKREKQSMETNDIGSVFGLEAVKAECGCGEGAGKGS